MSDPKQFVFHKDGEEYVIWGDGIHDDAPAIKALMARDGLFSPTDYGAVGDE